MEKHLVRGSETHPHMVKGSQVPPPVVWLGCGLGLVYGHPSRGGVVVV